MRQLPRTGDRPASRAEGSCDERTKANRPLIRKRVLNRFSAAGLKARLLESKAKKAARLQAAKEQQEEEEMEMGQAPTAAPTGQGQMPMTQEEALEMRRLLLQQSEHLQMLSQRIQAQESELVQLRSADPLRQVSINTPVPEVRVAPPSDTTAVVDLRQLGKPETFKGEPLSSQTGLSY